MTLRLALTAVLLLLPIRSALAAEEDSVSVERVDGVDVEERLGQRVPGELLFKDHRGRPVELRQLLDGEKPTIVVLAYYRCPMLCGLVLKGLADGLAKVDWRVGEEYRVVTVSIDPGDRPQDAVKVRARVLSRLGVAEESAEWPFLVGGKGEIRVLADALGFRYRYDPKTKQYAHPAAIATLGPDGTITRYLYGLDFRPRDLKLALFEAAEGKVGSSIERVILSCYRFDPASRRYGVYVFGFIRTGAALVLLALVVGVVRLIRRERQEGRSA